MCCVQTWSVRTTQLAVCVVVCDQYTIPTPDMRAGLRFTGLRRAATGKLEPVDKMVAATPRPAKVQTDTPRV